MKNTQPVGDVVGQPEDPRTNEPEQPEQPKQPEPPTAVETVESPEVEEPREVTDQIADYQDRVKAAHDAVNDAGEPEPF